MDNPDSFTVKIDSQEALFLRNDDLSGLSKTIFQDPRGGYYIELSKLEAKELVDFLNNAQVQAGFDDNYDLNKRGEFLDSLAAKLTKLFL